MRNLSCQASKRRFFGATVHQLQIKKESWVSLRSAPNQKRKLGVPAIRSLRSALPLLDLQACQARSIELFAPVQENSYTEAKRAAKPTTQIPRDQFTWLADEQTYVCPQGHRLEYQYKERIRRRSDQFVIQHRYQCSPEHCGGCPLASQCLRAGSKCRVIKRLEGQELLDAQRVKMKTPEGQARRKTRGAVIERAFGDAKGHRNCRRLHGRGLGRAKSEVGLLVLAQNVMTLHRLRRNRAIPKLEPS